MALTRYIGLLRGINVGGHKKIKMVDLRAMLATLGFTNVKTALASGNAAWDSDTIDVAAMHTAVSRAIVDTFGFSASVIIFPQRQAAQLVARNPFAVVEVTKNTRRYVTFLPAPVATSLSTPHQVPGSDFTILSVSDTEVCSVLTLTHTRSVDAMRILESEFGPDITTRSWNTVRKLAAL